MIYGLEAITNLCYSIPLSYMLQGNKLPILFSHLLKFNVLQGQKATDDSLYYCHCRANVTVKDLIPLRKSSRVCQAKRVLNLPNPN